ncbi:hypothetical protein VHEMI10104 [[Torrubiella] hemipterigena]|uniref:Inactive metallocarboxypeptidase ECM14 n=1 Tax=[Torrubiella] hemipterigena TaxID=1531966 RepID=A0A0A1THY4_9HYPO|nr:hypothetical protein VHEMI10104 [[Torrubiella] hemipterigena]
MKASSSRFLVALFTIFAFAFTATVASQSLHNQAEKDLPDLTWFQRLKDGTLRFLGGKHADKQQAHRAPTLDTLRQRYANEVVLRFNVSSTHEAKALSESSSQLFLDIWSVAEDYIDIRLHTDEVGPLLGLLPASLQSSHTTLISDLALAVYKGIPHDEPKFPTEVNIKLASLSSSAIDNLFFQDYQPLDVIERWMRLLEAMFPSHVEYISVGESYEGREIPALRVGFARSNERGPRKTLVVMGGLHAREWISTTTVNYVAWSFITSFNKEPMITKFLYNFEVLFIPVMNPDGVKYSWDVDRLWRKSRQHTNFRFCRGLDLDHAFGFGWGSSSVSDPCSESYGGEEPFQAAEAASIADWARNEVANNNVKFVGVLDLHSYSQQILYPYSHSCSVEPPNLENLEELAAGIAKAIRLSNGQSYSVASACEATSANNLRGSGGFASRIEPGGGSAIDWFYHDMSAHFSYQIKLRDTGSYGFLLPKDQIIPSGEEIFDAMKYVGDFLLGNNGIERAQTTHSQNSDHKDVDSDNEIEVELRRRVERTF